MLCGVPAGDVTFGLAAQAFLKKKENMKRIERGQSTEKEKRRIHSSTQLHTGT